jgi:hypothetical protein
MKHDSLHRSAMQTLMVGAVAAALACLAPAAAATAQEQAGLPTELIKVTNVSLDSAFTLANGVCRGAGMSRVSTGDLQTDIRPNCFDVSYLEDERMLAVTATPEVIARVRALLAEFDRLPATRSFQIIVLSADRSDDASVDIPANVQQALDDVREFLPYTRFNVLGSGWIRTSGYGEMTLPGPMELSAELDFRPTTDPTAPLLVERFSVYRRSSVNVPVEGGYTTQFTNRGILQTTFTIDPGETVVVGTSKLNGDDTAVVVLLTAVQN